MATDSAAGAAEGDLEWLSLDDDETVIWAGGPDRRTLIPAFVIGLPLSIVLIGLLIIASEYLRVTNTHYVVTNRALYAKTGVLSRDVKRIEHGKVQDISYSQSALGAHFGYGTVEVSTAGGSGVEMAFKSVPDPRGVQQRISDRLKRERGESGDDRTKDDVLEEILTELRAIRTAVDGGDGNSDGDSSGQSTTETGSTVRGSDDHHYEYDRDQSV
ncbi:PH domain-containing protein [Natrinema amylolyticum]|uniref:PH domain-containing protein n=1 Tax=Natrinema amylolyticum TaxID=2878679 RepID=UPI001CFAA641|nr:PH domain-containing protein [Natrinema amylolyticum]